MWVRSSGIIDTPCCLSRWLWGGCGGLARCWVSEASDTARRPRVGGCGVGLSWVPACRLVDRDGLVVVGVGWLFELWIVDASIFVAFLFCVFVLIVVWQAMKGAWWMPWHQEPMKDVGACDKPWGVGNRALIQGCPNGETWPESCLVTCT